MTIGIESPDKNQGVQYLFHETYHPGAIDLENGNIAIRFLATDEVLDNDSVELPSMYNIRSAYPNPFNPSVNIELSLYTSDNITLSLIDINGRTIDKLHTGLLMSGNHIFKWTPDIKISSGVYFVKMEIVSKGISDSKQITLVK